MADGAAGHAEAGAAEDDVSPHDVVTQMLAAGLDSPPTPLSLDGRVVRFGPKQAHWYRLREMRTHTGRHVVVGSFGNWRGQERHRVDVDWAGIGEEERAELQQRREAAEVAARAARNAESVRAAMSAAELWHEGRRDGRSAYLERKLVTPEACRFMEDGSILVPLLRYDAPRHDALRAVQRIWPDGTKRFTRGFEKPRCSLRLGLVAAGDPIIVCEGYATGLSLRMACSRRLAVFVALDAGNLVHVAQMLRELHPGNPLLIAADDDYRTAGNPGRKKAWEAARAVARCTVTYPLFRPGNRGPKDTDFNDLHAREGLHMLHRQLRMVLPMLGQWLPDGQPHRPEARVA